jgi:RNA ligase (TIGR02306 family)
MVFTDLTALFVHGAKKMAQCQPISMMRKKFVGDVRSIQTRLLVTTQQLPRMPATDWIPQVVKISEIIHHPATDRHDIATILKDLRIVVRRGEYKSGDLASYIPLNTIVPDTPQFYHLCPRELVKVTNSSGETKIRLGSPTFPIGGVPEKYRIIRATDIYGVFNKGVLIPAPEGLHEFDSVTEVLGLKKRIEIEEENIPGQANEGENGPSHFRLPETAIHSAWRYVHCLHDEEVVLTEKIHGSSAAYVHDGTRLWVRSRTTYQRRRAGSLFWDIALQYDLERRLRGTPNMAVFGEIYGLIKGFPYDAAFNYSEDPAVPRIRFYDVLDVAQHSFLDYDARLRFLADRGLEPVPALYRGPWLGPGAMFPMAEGPTTLGLLGHVREGWVLTPARERFEPELGSRMKLKHIGEGYLLGWGWTEA